MIAQEAVPPLDTSAEGRCPTLPRHVAARQFTDSSAVIWEVFEVRRPAERAASVSPGLEAGWLTFVAGPRKRRLASYPEGWWSLSDPELERLCLDARPSTPLMRAAPADSPAPRVARRTPIVEPSVEPSAAPDTVLSVVPAPLPAAGAHETLPDEISSMEDEIRSLARECRAAGLAAIAAMFRLKRLLGDRAIVAGTAGHKAARRLFVETFYFGRDR